jgi:predicted permease
VLIATLVAVLIGFIGFSVSENNVIIRIFSLLGGMTIPLLFIILGGNIYNDFKEKGTIQIVEIAKFVIIKNFIFPFIFLTILYYFNTFIPYHVALILIIQSAVPPVTAVPIVTYRVGGNRSIVNQFIVASFITSLVSIPIIMYLFELIIHPL